MMSFPTFQFSKPIENYVNYIQFLDLSKENAEVSACVPGEPMLTQPFSVFPEHPSGSHASAWQPAPPITQVYVCVFIFGGIFHLPNW
jgi:hypothetical protein